MAIKVCTLVFLIEGKNILLAMKKRGFGSGRWNGIGGKIEPGETVEQALVRETQEEIGVTPLQYLPAGYHEFKFPDGTADMHVHVFVCNRWDGEPVETEEMAPRWFSFDAIPYDDMWQDDRYWLPQVLQGKTVHGTFTFDEHDNMLDHDVQLV
ncbi:MAG TPA: 8-oxo-dGTP diphosphatase [Candidatus Saccharimonadales bacterium]|nr:8-oxo-dGTP diphosphatase [Candidatus Saccharimonadales bacterium]